MSTNWKEAIYITKASVLMRRGTHRLPFIFRSVFGCARALPAAAAARPAMMNRFHWKRRGVELLHLKNVLLG